MHITIAIRLALVAILTFPIAACAQSERARLLDAVVARGAQSAKDGKTEQARAAWSLALYFEPAHEGAKKQLEALPGAAFSLTAEETEFSFGMLRKSDTSLWCGFPPSTPQMEIVDLKMISDVRLLPNLRSTSMSLRIKDCDVPGVFLFLAQPSLSIAEVRKAYGEPRQTKKDDNGSEVLTYGRFKIVGAKDGSCLGVVFPPRTD
ncbi:MAG: hypothetical protein HY736_13430 [Verrucomicrobia bacterium]|nr:hypothetical protein [Verrucomicrobiota bacterium]